MLFPVVADERLLDRLLTGANPPVSQSNQPVRISFSRQNSVDDGQSGGTGDVTDHVMQLKIHLIEGLLHAMDVAGGHSN